MTESIIVAIITGAISLVGTIFAILSSQSKTLYRIELLENKVDKHNNVIERVYKLEQRVEDMQ